MKPSFSIAVYCGSRTGEAPAFAALAVATGRWIGRHGGQVVHGGGKSRLMAVVADATLHAGGRVVGVIPASLVDRELAHQGCSELHVVDTMQERKRLMTERADAFPALMDLVRTGTDPPLLLPALVQAAGLSTAKGLNAI